MYGGFRLRRLELADKLHKARAFSGRIPKGNVGQQQLIQAEGKHFLEAGCHDGRITHHDEGINQSIAHLSVAFYRVSRGREHVGIEGEPCVARERLFGRRSYRLRIVTQRHPHMRNQGWHRTTGGSGASVQSRTGDIVEVGHRTIPGDSAIRDFARETEGTGAEG